MAGIESVPVILMLFLCHQRYWINKEQRAQTRNMRSFRLHSRENTSVLDPFAYSDPHYPYDTVSHQSSWNEHPFSRATDERVMDHAERGPPTQGLNVQRKDARKDVPYKTGSLHLAGTKPGTVVNCDGTTKGDRSLVTTPSRAYLPTSSWRCTPEAPSPSTYLDTPSVAGDGELDHQLSTHHTSGENCGLSKPKLQPGCKYQRTMLVQGFS